MLTWIIGKWAIVKAVGLAGALAWGREKATSAVAGSSTQAVAIAVFVAAVLAAGIIGMVAINIHDRRVSRETRAVCMAERDAQALTAQLKQFREAVAERDKTIRAREDELQEYETMVDKLRREKEALRATAPDRDNPVFAADDPWLHRGKRAAPAGPAGPKR